MVSPPASLRRTADEGHLSETSFFSGHFMFYRLLLRLSVVKYAIFIIHLCTRTRYGSGFKIWTEEHSGLLLPEEEKVFLYYHDKPLKVFCFPVVLETHDYITEDFSHWSSSRFRRNKASQTSPFLAVHVWGGVCVYVRLSVETHRVLISTHSLYTGFVWVWAGGKFRRSQTSLKAAAAVM